MSAAPRKRVLATGVSHPSPFSPAILPVLAELLDGCQDALADFTLVLDPFAGTGGCYKLEAVPGIWVIGVELEPEWARLHPDTMIGDARHLPFRDARFGAVVTSPCYGNRLADHHDARDGSVRRSYTHDLGRPLTPGNAGAMQWGPEYRALHERAWTEARRVLAPGGRLILNIKDHIRGGKRQRVSGWHVHTLEALGFRVTDVVPVATSGMRAGANASQRVDAELVIRFDR